MSEPQRTPLFEFNQAHGGRMVDFAGWEMPVQYQSIVEEHKATRAAAGLFDVSHMGEATVDGPEAEAFLNYVLTNDISSMEDGKALYSLMLYPHGGVVDDLLVYRKAENAYLLCLNASNTDKDFAWLTEHSKGFDVTLRNVSRDWGLVALQGPKSFSILEDLTGDDYSGLAYYRFRSGTVAGVECIVSRTGYTGEKGVEIFIPWPQTEKVAQALFEAGKNQGLVLAGLGSRDSLRLEAGYSLYGHEIDEHISPVQAGLMWTVSMKKDVAFIGRKALEDEKAAGPAKRVVFFTTGGRRIARPGLPVLFEGSEVGQVLSGTFSPILNEAIGSALVSADCVKESGLEVDLRGKALPFAAVRPPFIPLNPQA